MATTWNPADKAASVTLSSGNLVASSSSVGGVRATNSLSGLNYFEVKVVSGAAPVEPAICVLTSAVSLTNASGGNGVLIYDNGANFVVDNTAGSTLGTFAGTIANGDVFGIAFDATGLKLYVARNGTWVVGNPAAGTGGITLPSGTYFPATFLGGGGGSGVSELDADTPTYSPPSGYTIIGGAAPTNPPSNTSVPTLSDTTPVVGQVITAGTGTWTESPTSYAYRWFLDGSVISGQTASTYTVQSGDEGKVLSVGVIATNGIGSSSEAYSADSSTIQLAPVVVTVTATGAYSLTLTSTQLPNGSGTLLSVEAWGPGAGGARRGRGSGGGAYALSNNTGSGWPVVSGDIIYGSVPAATTGTSATTGSTPSGDSWVRLNTNSAPSAATQGALAKAGSAGTSTVNGAGGTTAASIGTTKFAGGAGGNTGSGTTLRGAGGGGAGSAGAGGNASGATQGAAGSPDGGLGGASSTGTSVAAAAAPGGGGGAISGASGNGGTGGQGQLRFTIQPDLPSTGPQTLTGTLFTDGDSFGAGSIQPGPVSLTGTLFSSTNSFGSGSISATYTITGALFSEADSFGAGSLSVGPVTLTGTLFSDPDSFGAGSISQTGGTQTLTGTLFTDGDTFGAGVVSPGAVTLTGTLFTDGDSFGSGTVSVGPVTISGTLYTEADVFGAGVISQDGGPQIIVGTLFQGENFFGAGALSQPGSELPLYLGGGSTSDPYKRDELKAKDRKKLRAIIEKAMADPSEEAEQLQELVEPAVTYEGERVTVDWDALAGQLDAIARAANAYLAALEQAEADIARQAQQIAFEQDEDDVIALLLAA